MKKGRVPARFEVAVVESKKSLLALKYRRVDGSILDLLAMTRAKRFTIYASIFTAIYVLVFFRLIPVPLVEEETVTQLIPVVCFSREGIPDNLLSHFLHLQIPWWLLVAFGSYSLWSLGWGLLTFRDCDEAYEELIGVSGLDLSSKLCADSSLLLLQEISLAKADLQAKGVTVD